MRIVVLFNLAEETDYFWDLLQHIGASGYELELWDLISCKRFDFEKKKKEPLLSGLFPRTVLKIRGFRRFFIPFFNRYALSKKLLTSDHVHIHYMYELYSKYLDKLKRKECKLSITFWGSDFLRATESTRASYLDLLDYASSFSGSVGVIRELIKQYPKYINKYCVTYYGLTNLPDIACIDDESRLSFCHKYSIPSDRQVVALGYNGTPAQQHMDMFSSVTHLPNSLKEKLHLIVPMTYGGSKKYREEVELGVRETGVSYTLFKEFLSSKDNMTLRVVSDIVVNIQITDAFAASVSESIAGGNIVIVGEWLPYDLYDDWNIDLIKTSKDGLTGLLKDVLENSKDYYASRERAVSEVCRRFNWSVAIENWLKLY